MVRISVYALLAVMCSTHVPRAAFAESAADSFCDASVSTSSHLVDLTATIGPELVVFESAEGLGPDHRYQSSSQSDGDPANVSELRFGAHTGTHVDAPRHFARTNDAGVETWRLSWLNGPAIVVDIFGASALDAATLRSVADSIPDGASRVLFRTDNTRRGIMSRAAFDARGVDGVVGHRSRGDERRCEGFAARSTSTRKKRAVRDRAASNA